MTKANKLLSYFIIASSTIGSGYFSMTFAGYQISLFRALIICAAIFLAFRVLAYRQSLRIRIHHKYFSSYTMIIWLFVALVSGLWVKDYSAWVRAIYFIGAGVLCLGLFKSSFKSEKDVLGAFRLISVMAIIHNIIAWREVSTGNYLFLQEASVAKYQSYGAAVSTFYNMNNFALFLAIAIFFLLSCIKAEKIFLLKVLYSLTLISSMLLLFNHTYSRGSTLGLLLGFLVCGFSLTTSKFRQSIKNDLRTQFQGIFANAKRSGNKQRRSLIILISAICATGSLLFIMAGAIVHLFSTIGNDSNMIRINLIKNGFTFLFQTFGFGTGAGNSEYWMAHFSQYNTFGLVNMHNWWMEILVCYGVGFFVIYIAFYYRIFKSFLLILKTSKNKTQHALALGSTGFIVAFTIGSISPSSALSFEWIWVIWGIVITLQEIYTKKEANIT